MNYHKQIMIEWSNAIDFNTHELFYIVNVTDVKQHLLLFVLLHGMVCQNKKPTIRIDYSFIN